MSQNSPAKVQVKGINQVGIVVNDIEKMVEAYWNILGIGPWSIIPWEPPLVYDRKYHGKLSPAKEKIAISQVGAVQLELVQQIEGDSIYSDFLEEHGEGLHHLNFLVDDVDQVAVTLEREGFPSLQSARFGSPEQKGAFNYIYVEPLHTIWEPVYAGPG
jgi:catechol 2,3-dioxygenase-like lactoylglutathione lyase family enzyme